MSLVATRARRANAGNRMRELLQQELEADKMFEEIANDEDYIVLQGMRSDLTMWEQLFSNLFLIEEEDVADSDFDQSSGTDNDNEDAEEQLQRTEKKERQERKRKATSAFMNAVTRKKRATKQTRENVSNKTTTGRDSKATSSSTESQKQRKTSLTSAPLLGGVRSSSRTHTVQNKKILEQKLKEYEEKRAQLPKREKVITKPPTQEELLVLAKETEEENLASLRAFELREAERMKSARPVKERKINGPFIREISFIEGDDRHRRKKLVYEVSTDSDGKNVSRELKDVQWWDGQDGFGEADIDTRQARNLVVLTNFTREQELTMFEDWRRKPQKPKKVICPLTGHPAKYKDPKTGIPYATGEAYSKVRQLVNNKYVYSPILQAYVQSVDQKPAAGVPAEFRTA
ncbi:11401_t:CDS:2 [Paraglomus brasilianum]|uniref:11401_t:CDS:1 n=1 Tax=Paraglomus brasilianum TaxID=144538 RepID=A0A9N9DSX4_9GLOM|nr:11401_t:CDS:2 [Paraglomus brasilianum]